MSDMLTERKAWLNGLLFVLTVLTTWFAGTLFALSFLSVEAAAPAELLTPGSSGWDCSTRPS
jgi:hypothetical protein